MFAAWVDWVGITKTGECVMINTQNKSSASQIRKSRKRIGLPEIQVYYKVQAPESQHLTGWITEAEYKEIKLLRENNGSPLRVLARGSIP